MAKVRENMPHEADVARDLFIEIGRLRREGRAEALRQLEAKISEKSAYLKTLTAKLLAMGVRPYEIHYHTGMSPQTITNYRKWYEETMGVDDLAQHFSGEIQNDQVMTFDVATIQGLKFIHIARGGQNYYLWYYGEYGMGATAEEAGAAGAKSYQSFDWLTDDVIREAERETGVKLMDAPWNEED